ncbi:hypothetical protein LRS06_17320 [Hymenobacter sp. J193]|uniref:hypothetical protein n=1 Tax=Hymenobacter sp. J193 TaxID=2898429 RepID=UPI002151BC02|nr:hypothetical protein [Hymenobacter sp. J193]MCR5889499.1 hypothetical protein [Hymenobacter sp. J193]
MALHLNKAGRVASKEASIHSFFPEAELYYRLLAHWRLCLLLTVGKRCLYLNRTAVKLPPPSTAPTCYLL